MKNATQSLPEFTSKRLGKRVNDLVKSLENIQLEGIKLVFAFDESRCLSDTVVEEDSNLLTLLLRALRCLGFDSNTCVFSVFVDTSSQLLKTPPEKPIKMTSSHRMIQGPPEYLEPYYLLQTTDLYFTDLRSRRKPSGSISGKQLLPYMASRFRF